VARQRRYVVEFARFGRRRPIASEPGWRVIASSIFLVIFRAASRKDFSDEE
jgi:hypothetical protein